MRCLDLYGTVEGAVCVLDSLNHLLRTADIRAVLRRLRLFLEPGGLFVFDVNTPYKHRVVLGDNAFVLEDEDVVCVWRNRYIPRTCEVAMTLDFFVPAGEGRYDRLTDEVRERAYAGTTMRRLLEEEGFETLAVYGDRSFLTPGPEAERLVSWSAIPGHWKKRGAGRAPNKPLCIHWQYAREKPADQRIGEVKRGLEQNGKTGTLPDNGWDRRGVGTRRDRYRGPRRADP